MAETRVELADDGSDLTPQVVSRIGGRDKLTRRKGESMTVLLQL